MTLLDLTLPSPAENLACDEALLDAAECGKGGEVLRFWESPEYFVVVGYANKVATEVNVPECDSKGIPILRRCSGGGTVVQGPGCLNYALVLRINEDGPAHSISAANRLIMGRNREAIETVLRCNRREEAHSGKSEIRNPKSEIAVRGHTDLTLNGLKFSGNSQRRRKRFLLFHGTFLLNFDLAIVGEQLRHPSLQPDYRVSRAHSEFITNLNVPRESVKAALRHAWNANEETREIPVTQTEKLVAEKYSTADWNRRF